MPDPIASSPSPTAAITSAGPTGFAERSLTMIARAPIVALTLATLARAGAALAGQADTTRNPLASNGAAVGAGRASYDRTCVSCHGPAGQGDRGPALNTGRFSHGSEDADLFH